MGHGSWVLDLGWVLGLRVFCWWSAGLLGGPFSGFRSCALAMTQARFSSAGGAPTTNRDDQPQQHAAQHPHRRYALLGWVVSWSFRAFTAASDTTEDTPLPPTNARSRQDLEALKPKRYVPSSAVRLGSATSPQCSCSPCDSTSCRRPRSRTGAACWGDMGR